MAVEIDVKANERPALQGIKNIGKELHKLQNKNIAIKLSRVNNDIASIQSDLQAATKKKYEIPVGLKVSATIQLNGLRAKLNSFKGIGSIIPDSAISSSNRGISNLGNISTLAGKNIEQAFNKSSVAVEDLGKKVVNTNKNISTSMSTMVTSVLAMTGVYASTAFLDSLTVMDTKLRLATTGTREFNEAQKETRRIALESRASLSGTVDLYGRMARASTQLGASQKQIASVTEAIGKSLAVGAVDPTQATAGLLQLGQALSSGRLQGDELRSILENMPVLAMEIAKGLNVSVGALRTLGAEGKLTSKEVFYAIYKQIGSINEAFGKVGITYGQAFTNLANSLSLLFSASQKVLFGTESFLPVIINKMAIAIGGWSKALDEFSGNLLSIKLYIALFVIDAIEYFERLPDEFSKIFKRISNIDFSIDISKFFPKLDVMKQYITNWVTYIERAFFWLYDRVIGNSWIPDLVEGTISWIKKLTDKPIEYIKSFAKTASDLFKSIYEDLSAKFNSMPIVIKIKAAIGEVSTGLSNRSTTNSNEGSSMLLKSALALYATAQLLRKGVIQRIVSIPIDFASSIVGLITKHFWTGAAVAATIGTASIIKNYKPDVGKNAELNTLQKILVAISNMVNYVTNQISKVYDKYLKTPIDAMSKKLADFTKPLTDWVKNTDTYKVYQQAFGGLPTVNQGKYKDQPPGERSGLHDVVNALPAESRIWTIAAITATAAFIAAKIAGPGVLAKVAVSAITTLGLFTTAKTVEGKAINDFIGKLTLGFFSITKSITDALGGKPKEDSKIPGLPSDPAGFLFTLAKTALIFKAGREAWLTAGKNFATAPVKIADAVALRVKSAYTGGALKQSTGELERLAAFDPRYSVQKSAGKELSSQQLSTYATEGATRSFFTSVKKVRGQFETLSNKYRTQLGRASYVAATKGKYDSKITPAMRSEFDRARKGAGTLKELSADREVIKANSAALKSSVDKLSALDKTLKESVAESKKKLKEGVTNIAAGIGGALGSITGFNLGSTIAEGMADAPAIQRIGVIIASTLLGQGVGAFIGHTIAASIIGVTGLITGSFASVFGTILTPITAAGRILTNAIMAPLGIVGGGVGNMISAPFLPGGMIYTSLTGVATKMGSVMSMALMSTPFKIGAIIALAIGAAFLLLKNPEIWGELGKILKGAWDTFSELASGIFGDLQSAFEPIWVRLVLEFDKIAKNIGDAIYDALPGFLQHDRPEEGKRQQLSETLSENKAVALGTAGTAVAGLSSLLLNGRAAITLPAFISSATALVSSFFSTVIGSLTSSLSGLTARVLTMIPGALSVKAPLLAGLAAIKARLLVTAGIASLAVAARTLSHPGVLLGTAAVGGGYLAYSYYTDEKEEEKPKKKATGGHISGPGTGTSDSIPALLSNGEFVINAASTKQNRGLLERINSGSVPRFAKGGSVYLDDMPREKAIGLAGGDIRSRIPKGVDINYIKAIEKSALTMANDGVATLHIPSLGDQSAMDLSYLISLHEIGHLLDLRSTPKPEVLETRLDAAITYINENYPGINKPASEVKPSDIPPKALVHETMGLLDAYKKSKSLHRSSLFGSTESEWVATKYALDTAKWKNPTAVEEMANSLRTYLKFDLARVSVNQLNMPSMEQALDFADDAKLNNSSKNAIVWKRLKNIISGRVDESMLPSATKRTNPFIPMGYSPYPLKYASGGAVNLEPSTLYNLNKSDYTFSNRDSNNIRSALDGGKSLAEVKGAIADSSTPQSIRDSIINSEPKPVSLEDQLAAQPKFLQPALVGVGGVLAARNKLKHVGIGSNLELDLLDKSASVRVGEYSTLKVGKDKISIGTSIGFASGGHISGPGSGTSDSIPAMLSNGEFVINADAASKNRDILHAINSGASTGYFAAGRTKVHPNTPEFEQLKQIIIQIESGGNSSKISPQGAKGSMQIMESTFSLFNKKFFNNSKDFNNEVDRVTVATKHLEEDLKAVNFDPLKAAARYIGGPSAILPSGGIRDTGVDALGTTPKGYAAKVEAAYKALEGAGTSIAEKAESAFKEALDMFLSFAEGIFGADKVAQAKKTFDGFMVSLGLKQKELSTESPLADLAEFYPREGEHNLRELFNLRLEEAGITGIQADAFNKLNDDVIANLPELIDNITAAHNALKEANASGLVGLSHIKATGMLKGATEAFKGAITPTTAFSEDKEEKLSEFLSLSDSKAIADAINEGLNTSNLTETIKGKEEKYEITPEMVDKFTSDDFRKFEGYLKEYPQALKAASERSSTFLKGIVTDFQKRIKGDVKGFEVAKVDKQPNMTEYGKDLGNKFAEELKLGTIEGIKDVLFKRGSIKDVLMGMLDKFTSKVVDSFLEGLVSSTMSKVGIGKDTFANIIGGTGGFGSSILDIFKGEETPTRPSDSIFSPERWAGPVMSSADMPSFNPVLPASMVSNSNALLTAGANDSSLGSVSDSLVSSNLAGVYRQVDATNALSNDVTTNATGNTIQLMGGFAGLAGSLAAMTGSSGVGQVAGALGTAASMMSIAKGFGWMATGGHVSGPGTGTSDSIPTMLSNGEFVINAAATRSNRKLLELINSGRVSRLAEGGLVGMSPDISTMNASYDIVSKSRSSKQMSQQSTFNINVTGDVSMQTRKEIQAMIPQIATGVNMHNYERGGR